MNGINPNHRIATARVRMCSASTRMQTDFLLERGFEMKNKYYLISRGTETSIAVLNLTEEEKRQLLRLITIFVSGNVGGINRNGLQPFKLSLVKAKDSDMKKSELFDRIDFTCGDMFQLEISVEEILSRKEEVYGGAADE